MPPTASTTPTSPFNDNAQPSVPLPPPTSGTDYHRSRTSLQLSPLPVRSTSVSPTRYSSFLPSLRSSRNPTPERATKEGTEDYESIDSKRQIPTHKAASSVTKLASWFEGTSDPVRVGLVPSPRKDVSESGSVIDQAGNMFSSKSEDVDNFTRRPSDPQTPANSAGRSRFSFFRKPAPSQLSLAPGDNDALSRLDITEALFPDGQPDEFSAAAFVELQTHAEGTLRQFQTAHIEQQKALKSAIAAKEAQADDLEAAETRNKHLKLQLSEMAEKAAEQERQMAALQAELETLRRQQPVCDVVPVPARGGIRRVSQNSTGQHREKRTSDASMSVDSESDSDIISVFSDPMSADPSPGTSVCASPELRQATMYQERFEPPTRATIPVPECEKCHGLRPNEAWDVVSMMKAESSALKHRIVELECAHDDALAFIKSLNIV